MANTSTNAADKVYKATQFSVGKDTTRGTTQDPNNQRFVKYTYADGSTQTKYGGTLAWRYNNPGNLVVSEKRGQELGAIGRDKNGYAIFPDVASGNKAMQTTIVRNWGDLTLEQMIHKYAPEAKTAAQKKDPTYKNNNPKKYYQDVVNITGFDKKTLENTKMKDYPPDKFQQIIAAMKRVEKQKMGSYHFHSANKDVPDMWVDPKGKVYEVIKGKKVQLKDNLQTYGHPGTWDALGYKPKAGEKPRTFYFQASDGQEVKVSLYHSNSMEAKNSTNKVPPSVAIGQYYKERDNRPDKDKLVKAEMPKATGVEI